MELAEELKQAGDALLNVLSEFYQAEFDVVPFEGSWTAGQVTEHIYKADSGMLSAIKGTVTQTERAPDTHVKMLREAFLNFDVKMKSPDFILPSEGPHSRDELMNGLRSTFDKLAPIAAAEDLNLLCTDFEVPTLGHLTRLELLNFVSVHTQRHTHQLRNILQAL